MLNFLLRCESGYNYSIGKGITTKINTSNNEACPENQSSHHHLETKQVAPSRRGGQEHVRGPRLAPSVRPPPCRGIRTMYSLDDLSFYATVRNCIKRNFEHASSPRDDTCTDCGDVI
eukprot:scaffold89859_cov18-Prasinocladus_malaysianus.AAC.1